ncbi:MAG: hypothetical protein MUC60_10300 [Oscillatoria sp. Prado101]|nr:hypothetical protein [Oscillatoria sp. Prado101]
MAHGAYIVHGAWRMAHGASDYELLRSGDLAIWRSGDLAMMPMSSPSVPTAIVTNPTLAT